MPQQLTPAEHAIRLAQRHAEAWAGGKTREYAARQRFYESVRRAHEAGATYRAIGDAVGFSWSRIAQIVQAKDKR